MAGRKLGFSISILSSDKGVFSSRRAEKSFFFPAGRKKFFLPATQGRKNCRAEKPRILHHHDEKYLSHLGHYNRLFSTLPSSASEYAQLGIGELVLGHIRALKRIPDPIVRTLTHVSGRAEKSLLLPSVRNY